jgi:hypothetical protein
MLSHSLAAEQVRDQVKRVIDSQNGQLLFNQMQNQQWQKSFNF